MALVAGAVWSIAGTRDSPLHLLYINTYKAFMFFQPALPPWKSDRRNTHQGFPPEKFFANGAWIASNTSVVERDSLTLPIMAISTKSPLSSANNQKPKGPLNVVSCWFQACLRELVIQVEIENYVILSFLRTISYSTPSLRRIHTLIKNTWSTTSMNCWLYWSHTRAESLIQEGRKQSEMIPLWK